MGNRTWSVRAMVLGGLVAVAVGTWFTLRRGAGTPAGGGEGAGPTKIVPRLDRRRPAAMERVPVGRPPPPPLPPTDPRVRYREDPGVHIPGLRDPSPAVRSFSAWRLKAGEPTQEALLPLVQCLKDEADEVRRAAASALGEYADLPPETVKELVEMVRSDPSGGVRVKALWAASGRGDPDLLDATIALYRLGRSMETGEKTPPLNTIEAISRAGPGGYTFLKGLLADPDPAVRRAALQYIPACWDSWPEVRRDPERIPVLVRMLDDPQPMVRSSAAWALGRVGEEARPAKGRLLELLGDERDGGAHEYAGALLSLGAGAEEIGPLLAGRLASTDVHVRWAGCDGLGRLGAAAAPWRAALAGCVDDPDPRVRDAARSALALLPAR